MPIKPKDKHLEGNQNDQSEEKPKLMRCRYGHIRCDGRFCSPTGRNTDWKPEYNEEIVAFFSDSAMDPYKVHYDSGNKPHMIPSRPPQFEDFAEKIGIHRSNLDEWAREANVAKYKGFRDAYARAKQMQLAYFIALGTVNGGNPGFIQFMLKNNHGMRDKSEQEVSGPNGSNLRINVTTYGPNDLLSAQVAAGAPSIAGPNESSPLQDGGVASQGSQDDLGG